VISDGPHKAVKQLHFWDEEVVDHSTLPSPSISIEYRLLQPMKHVEGVHHSINGQVSMHGALCLVNEFSEETNGMDEIRSCICCTILGAGTNLPMGQMLNPV
jgi:hypothetical protein